MADGAIRIEHGGTACLALDRDARAAIDLAAGDDGEVIGQEADAMAVDAETEACIMARVAASAEASSAPPARSAASTKRCQAVDRIAGRLGHLIPRRWRGPAGAASPRRCPRPPRREWRRRPSASATSRHRCSAWSRTARSSDLRGLPQIGQRRFGIRGSGVAGMALYGSASARPASARGPENPRLRADCHGLVERQADDIGVGADESSGRTRRRGPGSHSRPPCRAIPASRDRLDLVRATDA